ncbi:hypothetical protein ACWFRB_17710 [Rhodococcus sp. NPDC055112]
MSVLKSRSLTRAAMMAFAAASIGGGLAVATPSVAAAQGSSATPAVAVRCGYYTQLDGLGVTFAYYRTCDLLAHRININTLFAPDHQICVPAGQVATIGNVSGHAGAIRNAVKIGYC